MSRLKSALEEMAKFLRPRTFREGELFARDEALYFIQHGQLRAPWGRWPGQVRTYGPGSTLGLEAFARWHPGLSSGLLSPSVRADTELRVLALYPSDFDVAFAGEEQAKLIHQLVAVHRASQQLGKILHALAALPRLANASSQQLLRLAEGATWEPSPPERVVYRDGEIPTSFHVLLSGRVESRRDKARISIQQAPTDIGLAQFILRTRLQGDVHLVPGRGRPRAEAVRFPGEWFNHLRSTDPEFDRAIRRGSRELAESELKQKLLRARHQVLLFSATRRQGDASLEPLAQLLAETIAVELNDHVRLLTVSPGEEDAPATRLPLENARNGWVTKETLSSSRKLNVKAPHSRDSTQQVNVTLVDLTQLEQAEQRRIMGELTESLQDSQVPVKLLHLGRSPREYPSPEALPKGVEVIFTGLLGPRPPPGLGLRLLKADRGADFWRKSLFTAARALTARRKWGVTPWPRGTVRVRFPPEWLLGKAPRTLREVDSSSRESLSRWARAATGRRVGVALGGGGAFGYVHLGLLQKLRQANIPVDMVSGSSFGAMVSAYYSGAGMEGLELLQRHGPVTLLLVPLAMISSRVFQWSVDLHLGPMDLTELEIPFFPVVTDADTGAELDIRLGTLGFGVRASGSLPPTFGPTIMGGRRLLDGGIVANVPVNVLVDERADLLIVSNPISRVKPRSRLHLYLPVLSPLWRELNPWRRIHDTLRMTTMMGRAAGESQKQGEAFVLYTPDFGASSALAFLNAREIVQGAGASLEVARSIVDFNNLQRSTLNNPTWRFTPQSAGQSERFELHDILFQGEALLESSRPALLELASFLVWRTDILEFLLTVQGPDPKTAAERARALEEFLRPRVGQRFTVEGLARSTSQPAPALEVVRTTGQPRNRTEAMETLRSLQDSSRARSLAAKAHEQYRLGALELARLLALEAAWLADSPEVESVIRIFLETMPLMRTRFDCGANVLDIAWHPKGDCLAVVTDKCVVQLWTFDGNKVQKLYELPGGAETWGVLARLSWSSTGRKLAVTAFMAFAIWEVPLEIAAAPPVLVCKGSLSSKASLSFPPDTDDFVLVSGWRPSHSSSADKSSRVALLDLRQRGQPVWDEPAMDAAWDPRGSRFAMLSGDDNKLLMGRWNQEGVTKDPESWGGLSGSSFEWHPKGRSVLLEGPFDQYLLQLVPGAQAVPLPKAIGWSQDGDWLLTLSDDKSLQIRDGEGALLKTMPIRGDSLRFAWQPRTESEASPCILATASLTTVSLWDPASGHSLGSLTGHENLIQDLTWSPNGRFLATGSRDGQVRIWAPLDRNTGAQPWLEPGGPPQFNTSPAEKGAAPLEWYNGASRVSLQLPLDAQHPGTPVSWSPDGTRAAAVPKKEDKVPPWCWTAAGPRPPPPETQKPAELRPLLWAPDSKHLAAAVGTTVTVWKVSDDGPLQHIRSFKAENPALTWPPAYKWAPQGARLALSELGIPIVRLYDFKTGTTVPIKEKEERPLNLAWSPDGSRIAIWWSDRRVRVYSSSDGSRLASPEFELPHSVKAMAWDPQGERLAVSYRQGLSQGGMVEIWSLEGEKLVGDSQPLVRAIAHLVWSRDGSRLAVVPDKGEIQLWANAGLDRWQRRSTGLVPAVNSPWWAAFDSNGSWLAVMNDDGKPRFYPMNFDLLVSQLAAMPWRNELTAEERSLYLGDEAQRALEWWSSTRNG